jgi:hypothetical protein
MAAAPYTRRIPKRFKKTVTFDGTAGAGAVGTVAVGTVTGAILITSGAVRCTTLLTTAAGATVEMGTAGNTAGLIAQTTGIDIDANEFWQDATPELRVSPAIVNIAVGGDIIITVGTDAVTAGVLEIVFYWLPLSDDGNLA